MMKKGLSLDSVSENMLYRQKYVDSPVQTLKCPFSCFLFL